MSKIECIKKLNKISVEFSAAAEKLTVLDNEIHALLETKEGFSDVDAQKVLDLMAEFKALNATAMEIQMDRADILDQIHADEEG
jgi:hypothetical protein